MGLLRFPPLAKALWLWLSHPGYPFRSLRGQHFSLILFPSHSATYFFFFLVKILSLLSSSSRLPTCSSHLPAAHEERPYQLCSPGDTDSFDSSSAAPPPPPAAELSISLPSGFPPGPQSFSSPLRTSYPQHLFLLGSCGLPHQFLLTLQTGSVAPTPRDQSSLSWMLTM